jgi:hypothetical protein
MKDKTSGLVPNTLTQALVVLEDCCMMLLQRYYDRLMAVEKYCYNKKFQPPKITSKPLERCTMSSRLIWQFFSKF